MSRFASRTLLALKAYDASQNPEEEIATVNELRKLELEFSELRTKFETVYSKTRILNKPEDYILDQDHHHHLANQSINFDWQFYAEIMFLEKLNGELEKELFLENTDALKK